MILPVLHHTKIIGLGHKARQGKDLVASILERYGEGRVRRFACSDALYAHCMVAHGMTQKDAVLLQDVGVAMRGRDPDIWVRCCFWMIKRWDDDARGAQLAVIPDIRFPNEARAVQTVGGQLIRIRRFVDNQPFVASDRPATHISETALDDFPWPMTIDNDGEVADLEDHLYYRVRPLFPAVFGGSLEEAA